jgi:hypothetical protein
MTRDMVTSTINGGHLLVELIVKRRRQGSDSPFPYTRGERPKCSARTIMRLLSSVGLTIDDTITPLDGQLLCCYIMYIRAASEGRGSLRFSLRSEWPDVQQLRGHRFWVWFLLLVSEPTYEPLFETTAPIICIVTLCAVTRLCPICDSRLFKHIHYLFQPPSHYPGAEIISDTMPTISSLAAIINTLADRPLAQKKAKMTR